MWAALILAAGFAASSAIAYGRTDPEAAAYEARISPIVEQYNGIIRRWNTFVDEFNAYVPPAPGETDRRALASLALTDRLATDTQHAISGWNAVAPPVRLAESHRLAAEAMRTTQDAFLEMSLYLDELGRHGVAFSDRAEAASLKLVKAAELLDLARASALAAR